MKRAIGLIAATLLSTSVYSQDYDSSSAGQSSSSSTSSALQQDQTPDYQSRQSESGAPASSQSSSVSGYDRDSNLSGGNNSTGQSSGANISGSLNQDQTLTTRDSDLNGSEYRGTLQSEPEQSFNSELNVDSSVSGSAAANIHAPAAPVRESTSSEGWSGAGTFSGAGPGSVSGSASSDTSATDSIPSPTESSQSFSADLTPNSGLNDRDADLSSRGLMPDSDEISVGAPASGEVGFGSSSSDNSSSSSSADAAYGQSLEQRVQSLWGIDVPANPAPRQMMQTPRLFDQSLDQINGDKLYNGTSQSSEFSGAPGASVSGSAKSHDDDDNYCDDHKGNSAAYEEGWQKDSQSELDGSVRSSGSAVESDERLDRSLNSGAPGASVSGSASSSDEQTDGFRGSVRSSGSAVDHDERLSQERDSYRINRDNENNYHINRSDSVPSDYGDRPTPENED